MFSQRSRDPHPNCSNIAHASAILNKLSASLCRTIPCVYTLTKLQSVNLSTRMINVHSQYSGKGRLAGTALASCGALSNTLYSCRRFSSSSRILATFPHLLHQYLQQMRVDLPIAVIWSAPDCDYLTIKHELVALHYQLMRSSHKFEIIHVSELAHDVGSEEESSSSW